MRGALLGISVLLTMAAAPAAQAGNAVYSDPYPEPAHNLRFANLEATVGRDPRIPSADPRWDAHHTPPAMLARAGQALRAAVPAGTRAKRAMAILEKAGARCASAGTDEVDCMYRDVETPYGGADWDNVTWRVKLALTGGRVSDLAVTRDWTRR